MSFHPLPYDDADNAADMRLDCGAATVQLRLPHTPDLDERVMGRAPSIEYDDFPRDIAKPEIRISDAAVLLAGKLHLHLD